jgi:hypothetical protein
MKTTTDPNNDEILVPVKEALDVYYRKWLEGVTQDDMIIALRKFRVKASDLEKYSSCFMNYCRYKVQFESNETLAKYNHALQIPLTAERRGAFVQMAQAGLSIAKISKVMAIPVMTIYDYWFVIDPGLRMEIETAADILDAKITMSLSKRAVGYKVKNKSVTTTKGTGADGRDVDLVVESVTERDVPADINAIKLWLINRTPERFSLDGSVNRSDNRGKIMEYIEDELHGRLPGADLDDEPEVDADQLEASEKEDSDV